MSIQYKEPTRNPFAQSAHDKAQEAIDRAREIREKKLAGRGKSKAEPRLIAEGNLLRCSLCSYPIQPDEKPSVSVAFAEHLLSAHPPEPTSTM
jgi:hypothetical protein